MSVHSRFHPAMASRKTRCSNGVWILLCLSLWVPRASKGDAPIPENVSITQSRVSMAKVSWDLPQDGNTIGYIITQQKKDGNFQRLIKEVNTTAQACCLWDLEPGVEYIVQVQAVTLHGAGPPSHPILFHTRTGSQEGVEEISTKVLPCTSSSRFLDDSKSGRNQKVLTPRRSLDTGHHAASQNAFGDIRARGSERIVPRMMAGDLIIIFIVLVMWAAVIALFFKQYNIIKDNDSSYTSRNDKAKRPPQPSQRQPSVEHLQSKSVPTTPLISIQEV
uniref:Fibronectin type-III domain-containing protein n=1 Tax=Eptatretus burgeri TaxID=7764 RepID=A0A8C4QSA5_EPTBU